MDEIDLALLEMLKGNSRFTYSELGKKVNLSVPAVAERLRKLEGNAIIEKYTVKLNRDSYNYRLLAFVLVNLERTGHIEPFRRAMGQHRAVLECHHIAGVYDYLLKVVAADTRALEEFLSHTLKTIPGVAASNTLIVLSTLKEELNP